MQRDTRRTVSAQLVVHGLHPVRFACVFCCSFAATARGELVTGSAGKTERFCFISDLSLALCASGVRGTIIARHTALNSDSAGLSVNDVEVFSALQ